MKLEYEESPLQEGFSGFEIPKNRPLIQEDVNQLLEKGVVVECEHETVEYFIHFLDGKDRWNPKIHL